MAMPQLITTLVATGRAERSGILRNGVRAVMGRVRGGRCRGMFGRGAILRAMKQRLVSSRAQSASDVTLVPCLSDNYAYIIHNPKSGLTAVVDPSEAAPVKNALESRGLSLDYILNTHHHWDHVGGNEELKKDYGAQIVGPAEDKARIPGIDLALADGEVWDMKGEEVRVIHTPGHTSGHCSFYLPNSGAVFTGDTLFSLGCGRLFEGTPAQMHSSLAKISSLPESTLVFCGHEYTQSNAKFALAVDPSNPHLKARCEEIDRLRSGKQATIPTTIGLELKTNPFLRANDGAVQKGVGIGDESGKSEVEVFAAIRSKKDTF
ncbi:hypothetical protein AAMO2058_001570700 [Amorphochlora amoebiformis]